ncbi:MAG: hypothetical protein RSC29_02735, partial [Oscillospiraceae bacterium]
MSKPLDNDELIGVMLNIKEKIENRLDINHRLDTLSSHIPYLRNTFITGLLEGKIQNKTVMKNKCNEYEIPIPHGNYIVVSFCIDNIPSLPNSVLEKLNELMTETIDCAINTYNFNAFYANTSPGNIGMVIIREKEHLNVDNFTTKDLLFYIQKEFASVSDNTLTIGLSKNHTDNSELSTAYNESKIALT